MWPSGELHAGRLTFREGRITEITREAVPQNSLILPGFVDTHVHGGGGGDTMDGSAGIVKLARLHAQHGTTSLLPTTITAPWPEVLAALEAVKEVQRQPLGGTAQVLGAHLEGPFISPLRLGAQPPYTLEPTPERVQELLALDIIRVVTLAPERPGAMAAAEAFARAGVRVGIGHTAASAETVSQLLSAVRSLGGRSAATHLFNAMGGIQGREPGPAAALLTDPQTFIEVILDGVHVHPTSFNLACLASARVMLVSDAMRAAGLGDGTSELGGQRVLVRSGEARLESGNLAGSVLTLDLALRNAVRFGLSLGRASQMCSLLPAQSLGLQDRGELRVGLRADVVVLTPNLHPLRVFVGGEEVPGVAGEECS